MSLIKKKLAIDFGNSNMKAVGGAGKDLDFTLVKSLASTNSTDQNNVVKYNDHTIHFGTGVELCTTDKTKRKYKKESILLLAYNLFGPGYHDIDLAAGLPIGMYKSAKKHEEEEYLRQIKKIEGYVNGHKVTVALDKTIVCAEVYSAFLSLSKVIPKDYPILLVDHGYQTTDIIALSFYGGKWHIDDHLTIDKGMREIYNEFSSKLLDIDVTLDAKAVEHRLTNCPILLDAAKTDLSTYYKKCTNTINDIYNQIQIKFTDYRMRSIYLAGGGAAGVSQMLDYPNVKMPNNDQIVFCNAVGYYLQL